LENVVRNALYSDELEPPPVAFPPPALPPAVPAPTLPLWQVPITHDSDTEHIEQDEPFRPQVEFVAD